MSLGQQMRLVAFNLEEIIAAFFDNGPAQLALAVQGIGRDDFAVQRRLFFEQGCRGGLFAPWGALFLIIHGEGLG